jgi:hypothetical protein
LFAGGVKNPAILLDVRHGIRLRHFGNGQFHLNAFWELPQNLRNHHGTVLPDFECGCNRAHLQGLHAFPPRSIVLNYFIALIRQRSKWPRHPRISRKRKLLDKQKEGRQKAHEDGRQSQHPAGSLVKVLKTGD